ncbi:hypothetical protein B0F90DRAFT_1711462 [Multifurca ochricompacta]|uniref:F-box domain-containing protein n=1 Tax=Multifurca ochricompacta TaxID=376703 RepID=A0AAD4QPM6_9AGAM|nr:hypothetical protein B0F90DRAFT_1711462 [Multifurca ochricompacta]
MFRKKARHNKSSLTAGTKHAPALQTPYNLALQLPTELVYMILATSMGDYLGDVMLYPSKVQQWDATLTFLHVSHTFRGCTIKLLYHLWGDTFIHERTSVIGNYKPTYSIFRQLSRQARSAPLTFTYQDTKPKLLSARVVRHPISPLARIWSALIRNTAAANAVLLDAENDRIRVDFEDVYAAEDLRAITNSYTEIPAGVRSLLLGCVMHQVMTQAVIWTKLKELSASISNVIRLLTRLVEAGAQIEIRAELPEITEDSVVQVSRDKHTSLAGIFSLAIEDIPPLHSRHATAVGLDMVLFLLKLVESEGSMYVELCQIMRNYIASYLTDTERARYLR